MKETAVRADELAQQIITAEFGYVAQTAFQANEDRARAWQYFFVTFATLIAALLSTQVEGIDQRQLYLTFVVIFTLLAVLGVITILQLVRLRQAWLESVRAMNQIKERLVADDPALAELPPPAAPVARAPLGAVGAPWADSGAGRVKESPHRMPGI